MKHNSAFYCLRCFVLLFVLFMAAPAVVDASSAGDTTPAEPVAEVKPEEKKEAKPTSVVEEKKVEEVKPAEAKPVPAPAAPVAEAKPEEKKEAKPVPAVEEKKVEEVKPAEAKPASASAAPVAEAKPEEKKEAKPTSVVEEKKVEEVKPAAPKPVPAPAAPVAEVKLEEKKEEKPAPAVEEKKVEEVKVQKEVNVDILNVDIEKENAEQKVVVPPPPVKKEEAKPKKPSPPKVDESRVQASAKLKEIVHHVVALEKSLTHFLWPLVMQHSADDAVVSLKKVIADGVVLANALAEGNKEKKWSSEKNKKCKEAYKSIVEYSAAIKKYLSDPEQHQSSIAQQLMKVRSSWNAVIKEYESGKEDIVAKLSSQDVKLTVLMNKFLQAVLDSEYQADYFSEKDFSVFSQGVSGSSYSEESMQYMKNMMEMASSLGVGVLTSYDKEILHIYTTH